MQIQLKPWLGATHPASQPQIISPDSCGMNWATRWIGQPDQVGSSFVSASIKGTMCVPDVC